MRYRKHCPTTGSDLYIEEPSEQWCEVCRQQYGDGFNNTCLFTIARADDPLSEQQDVFRNTLRASTNT